MATAAQITAAVTNAQLSTGPRTTEGKAISSRNALKFGIFAKSDILPGEDPAALDELTNDIVGRYQPQSVHEAALCHQAIHGMWLYLRFVRIENEIAQLRTQALPAGAANPLGQVYADDLATDKVLEKVDRRRRAALRQYTKAIEQLREIYHNRQHAAKAKSFAEGLAENPVRSVNSTIPHLPPASTPAPTPIAGLPPRRSQSLSAQSDSLAGSWPEDGGRA